MCLWRIWKVDTKNAEHANFLLLLPSNFPVPCVNFHRSGSNLIIGRWITTMARRTCNVLQTAGDVTVACCLTDGDGSHLFFCQLIQTPHRHPREQIWPPGLFQVDGLRYYDKIGSGRVSFFSVSPRNTMLWYNPANP